VQLSAIHSSVEQYMQEHPMFGYLAAEMVTNYIGVEQGTDYELDRVLEKFERSASPDIINDPEDILEQVLAQMMRLKNMRVLLRSLINQKRAGWDNPLKSHQS